MTYNIVNYTIFNFSKKVYLLNIYILFDRLIIMKLFINIDESNRLAHKTREELIRKSESIGIEIVDDVNQADILCSIGGDGTFLKTSHLSQAKPIIGINCGTIGYLTDVKPTEIDMVLNDLLDETYYIEERMMLEGEIIKNDGSILEIPSALNDITISKNTFGIIRFDCFIDSKLINSYTSDGIIISTPTGSTAYNLSCGGPIVDPTASLIILTPIASHSILNRSIVLSSDSTIEIKITQIRNNSVSYVLYDGQALEVTVGDTIRIKKSQRNTKIIKLTWQSFIENIHQKIR